MMIFYSSTNLLLTEVQIPLKSAEFPHYFASQGVEEEIPPAAVPRQTEVQVKVKVAPVIVDESITAEAVWSEFEAGSDQGVCEGRRG